MSYPKIDKGQTFTTRESITNKKLHDLVDLAEWTVQNQAAGDIIYYNGTDWVRIAKGSAGQVLKMNVGATAPEWAEPVTGYTFLETNNLTLALTLHAPSVTTS